VVLGDVADVKGEAAEVLADMEVATAPLPKQSKRFQSGFIMARLERGGAALEGVEVTGADMVKVTTMHQEISAEAVERSLREQVVAAMPWAEDQAVVEVSAPSFAIVAPEGPVEFQWTLHPTYQYVGRGTARGEVFVNGVSEKSLVARINIEAYAEVVTPVRDIARGRIIGMDDLATTTVAVSRMHRDAVAIPEEIVGMVARKTLMAGSPLTGRDVVRQTVVKRRQLVTVELMQGTMRITTQAEALQDACAGDIVRCKNIGSDEEFAGVAQPNGVVLVK
jgi:flagella basal body P-ring formation protein FlgA